MSEEINGRKVFSLLEVTRSIQRTISERYAKSFWVKAEMNKLNFYQHSGHCYPDLVEKIDGRVVAQLRANLWKDDFNRINADFERVLKEPLKDGVKILIQAMIGFTPEHGLSLRILDIDPSFTLGDLEREKQETIGRLQHEGIYTRNKELTLPVLPQRIALISVQTSKGYADFNKVLEAAHRNWGYSFFSFLFPSLLQGDNAVGAIIQQLRRIRKVTHHFDAVAIVRGGGGDIGLSCYNHYDLAREIALFPIPVITGIGHATNETVVEMVAHKNAITPTSLAEFLVQKFHNFSVPLRKAEEEIATLARNILSQEKTAFTSELKLLRSAARTIVSRYRSATALLAQSLLQQSRFSIRHERNGLESNIENISRYSIELLADRSDTVSLLSAGIGKAATTVLKEHTAALANIEQHVNILNPENVLKRGYSITRVNGKLVRSTREVKEGDVLDTRVVDGQVSSTVNSPSQQKIS